MRATGSKSTFNQFSVKPLSLAVFLLVGSLGLPTLAAESAKVASYDLSTSSLDTSLNRIARQSGKTIAIEPQLVSGLNAPAIKGEFTPEQAFAKVLQGSGLEVVEQQGGYQLRKASQAQVGKLQTVRVTAQAAEGSVDNGYRSETIAAVGPWEGRKLQDTPYSITVIPADMIKNLQATTPDQIYRVVPTIEFIRTQSENDQPGINMRGFNVGTAYRDGLPADQYGHGTSTEDVERVEVFSGLSGFLYGPGNVGGMINYITKRPTAEPLNRITLGNNGGSNYYIQGDSGGPIDSDGRFGYRVNAIYQDGETAIEESDIKKSLISAAFDWHLTDDLLWQIDIGLRDYEIHGSQANWGFAAGVERPSADFVDVSKSWAQPWSLGHYETRRYGTQLRWDASESLTLRTAWQYNNSQRVTGQGSWNELQADGTYTQDLGDVYAPGDNSMRSEQFDTRGNAFADIRFETGDIAHKLTTGMQYQHSVQERYSNYSPDIFYTDLTLDHPTYFDKPVQQHTDRGPRGKVIDYSYTTWLIGDDITFNNQWSLLAGAAYSTIDSARITLQWPADPYKKSAVTPNISLIYKPTDVLTTYATYIESLEQGGAAGDKYNGFDVVNAGEVMNPLISKQVELGAKITVGKMLFTTALFQINKGLEYYDLTDPTKPRYVQDGLQTHRGIELTAFGNATENLTLTGGFTLLDPEVKEQKEAPELEGKRPTDVADKLAKLRAEYRFPSLQGLSLSGSVNYIGSRYGDLMNTDQMSGYTLYDAGLRYETELMQQPVTLRFDALNLTGRSYWASSWSLGEPRTLRFSVDMEF